MQARREEEITRRRQDELRSQDDADEVVRHVILTTKLGASRIPGPVPVWQSDAVFTLHLV